MERTVQHPGGLGWKRSRNVRSEHEGENATEMQPIHNELMERTVQHPGGLGGKRSRNVSSQPEGENATEIQPIQRCRMSSWRGQFSIQAVWVARGVGT